MEFLKTYAKELVALFVPCLSAIIARLKETRVRLTYSTPHGYTFLVQEPLRGPQGAVISPTQAVHTRSFFFRNAGRAIAHNVEIVFNWKPLCLNVWPSRHFEENTEPDNRYVLIFASLAPGEFFGCELLSVNNDLPALITVRSDEMFGIPVSMSPQPIVPRWRTMWVTALAFIGLAAGIYLLLIGLQWLILNTPSTRH